MMNRKKKFLTAAITMSLVMGVSGTALAGQEPTLYGSTDTTATTPDDVTNNSSTAGVKKTNEYIRNVTDAASTGADYTVTGGTWKYAYGGYSSSGTAGGTTKQDGNQVNISGGTVVNVFGGSSNTGAAENNTVNISGTANITGVVLGGTSGYGNATYNNVNISGGTINGDVYGGNVEDVESSGAVQNNKVNISGGTVNGAVYGGISYNGVAENNTVNISGTANLTNAVLYGYNAEAASHSGNTLTIDSDWSGTVKSIQNFDSVTNNGNLTVSECLSTDGTLENKTIGATASTITIKSDGTLKAGNIVAEGADASIIAEAGSTVVINGTSSDTATFYSVLAKYDGSNSTTIKLLGNDTSITATNTNGKVYGVDAEIGSTLQFVDGSIKVTGSQEAGAVISEGSAKIELGGNNKTVTLTAISTNGNAIGLFDTGKIDIASGATVNVALQAATGKSASVLSGTGNITNSGTLQLGTIANDGTVSPATAATGYTVENFTGTYTQTGADAVTDFSQMDVIAKGTYNIEGGEFKANNLTVDNNKTFTLGSSDSSATATITGETEVKSGSTLNIKNGTFKTQGVTNYGTLTNTGTITTNIVRNNGTFNMSGDLSYNISAFGTTVLQSDISVAGSHSVQGTLNTNGKTINMQEAADATGGAVGYNSLTVGTLAGTGNLYIDADLANSKNDKLNVSAAASGATLDLSSILVRSDSSGDNGSITYVTGNGASAINYTINANSTSGGTAGTSIVAGTSDYTYTFSLDPTNNGNATFTRTLSMTLSDFITGTGQGATATAYTLTQNTTFADANDLTTSRPDGSSKDLTLGINEGVTLSGVYSEGQKANGIIIANGYNLSFEGPATGAATMSGFTTALTNNTGGTLNVSNITFADNTKDIDNSGTLTFTGTNALSDAVSNSGTIYVGSNTDNSKTSTTTINSISQSSGSTTIATGSLLNADAITLTGGSLTNNGNLNMNYGTGSDKLDIQTGGTFTNSGTANITNISNAGTLKLAGSSSMNSVAGTGITEITGGTTTVANGFTQNSLTVDSGASYVQNGGNFVVNGDVANNGSVTLMNLTKNDNEDGTLANAKNKITGTLTNNGTFTLENTYLTVDKLVGSSLTLDSKSKFFTIQGGDYNNIKLDTGAETTLNGDNTIEGNIEAAKGTINVSGETKAVTEGSSINIGTLNGSGAGNNTFVVNSVNVAKNDNGNLIKIGNANNIAINVASSGATNVEQSANNDAAIANVEKNGINSLVKLGQNSSFNMNEGLVFGDTSYVNNGDGVQKIAKANTANSQVSSALSSSAAFGRMEANDIRKRIGDVRLTNAVDGIWTRFEKGQLEGSGVEHGFNKYQIGADHKISDKWRAGGAFSYTKGTATYERGENKIDTYSLAAYGVYTGKNGEYADIIARVGQDKSEMGFMAGSLSSLVYQHGKLTTGSMALSGEIGKTYMMKSHFFIEPQAELMYSHTTGDSFDSNGVNYDLSSIDSLQGRIGFALGYQAPDKSGVIYSRISALHEFAGNRCFNVSSVYSSVPNYSDGVKTWWEWSVGGQINLSKATYFYADIEKTWGASMDEKYRATAGFRYSF